MNDDCPRLLINREKVGQKSGFFAMLGVSGGMDFDSPDNTRDVAWLGDCDEGCRLLAEKLGWDVSIQFTVSIGSLCVYVYFLGGAEKIN